MAEIRGPQTTLLASDHPKTAHSSTPRPTFTPKELFPRRSKVDLFGTPCAGFSLRQLSDIVSNNHWRFGGQKAGFAPQPMRHACSNCLLSHSSATEGTSWQAICIPRPQRMQKKRWLVPLLLPWQRSCRWGDAAMAAAVSAASTVELQVAVKACAKDA
eukprot:1157516-Pelagomonas_calceolata.AAC.6